MSFRRLMDALKLFLPSWNFFNDFAAVPRLECRRVQPEGAAAGWEPLFTNHTTRGVGRILFNPQGNLELLEKSLIDRADDEARMMAGPDGAGFATTETHSALARLTRARLAKRTDFTGADKFQFRLTLGEPGAVPTVIFTSAALPLVEDAP